MKCAYCGAEAKGTKEHIISKSVLNLFPECFLTINGEKGSVYCAEPVIKDVCTKCNEKKLSYIDYYAKNFIEKYFTKEYNKDESLEIEYNYLLLQKMLLKYAYNDLRARKKNVDFFSDKIKNFLLNKESENPLENVSILGGLAINTSPMPLWMSGNKKIQWGESPFFVSDYMGHMDYFSGEVTFKQNKENFTTIKLAYIFRFYTGQFILICWDVNNENFALEKNILNFNYPYEELTSEGISVLKRCTGYLNYHLLNIIDTKIGLEFQDEMTLMDTTVDKKNLEILNKIWKEEEKRLKEKYKK